MNPAIRTVLSSFCLYMVGPLNGYMNARLNLGEVCCLFKALVDSFVYSVFKAVFRGYGSNPALMLSQQFAGLSNNTVVSLAQRSFAQVLGGLIGAITVVVLTGGGGSRSQHPLPPVGGIAGVQVVISYMYLFICLVIEACNIQGDGMSEFIRDWVLSKFMKDWVLQFIVTVAFEWTGAKEMGLAPNLNPAHKFGETLIKNTTGRKDFFLYWFLHIFLSFLSLAKGKTLMDAITGEWLLNQISFGAITSGLIFRFMNEVFINITRGHILYWVCPFIVAIISGVTF